MFDQKTKSGSTFSLETDNETVNIQFNKKLH